MTCHVRKRRIGRCRQRHAGCHAPGEMAGEEKSPGESVSSGLHPFINLIIGNDAVSERLFSKKEVIHEESPPIPETSVSQRLPVSMY